MIKQELNVLENKERAELSLRFFKTGKGEYGEGDKFLGITVPEQRKIAKKYYKSIEMKEIEELLHSKFHEHRLTALIILTMKCKGNEKEVFDFYLKNTKYINNWDLVDTSAHKIVGEYLLDKNIDLLRKLALSRDLWERRISIISTFAFIRHKRLKESIEIAELLLKDKHDLMHKAVGWMLREVGKKDVKTLEQFLQKHKNKIPRTMLRYAIERLPEKKRKYYMN